MSVAGEVEEFILHQLTLGGGIDSIAPDEDLLATGIVDSHGVMELVGFLTGRYGIVVSDDDLKPENFQTLESIDAFVQRTKG